MSTCDIADVNYSVNAGDPLASIHSGGGRPHLLVASFSTAAVLFLLLLGLVPVISAKPVSNPYVAGRSRNMVQQDGVFPVHHVLQRRERQKSDDFPSTREIPSEEVKVRRRTMDDWSLAREHNRRQLNKFAFKDHREKRRRLQHLTKNLLDLLKSQRFSSKLVPPIKTLRFG